MKAVAKKVAYVGSPEHKAAAAPQLGVAAPRPRNDASKCPVHLSDKLRQVMTWLKFAVIRGNVGGHWEQGFPRYIWHKDSDGTCYEARLTNAGSGQYKGYPLKEDEIPDFLK